MEPRIGVFGATITIVGLVVGASIYILPGTIAASAGPGVLLSYALAGATAIFSCIIAAQIGAAFPATGASYVAVSELLSPLIGFLAVCLMITAACVANALLAFGFADHVRLFFPDVSRTPLAIGLVLGLGLLNTLGVRETVLVQTLLVAAFLSGIGLVIAVALPRVDADLLTPVLPNGLAPVLSGAVAAYFSFTGFNMIIELGGELKSPERTIPASLFISFITVALFYLLASLSIVGVIPWRELSSVEAALGETAMRLLPRPAAQFVILTAIAATASTVNALFLGYSRDLLALSQARLLPRIVGARSARAKEPVVAVGILVSLSLFAVLTGARIIEFATITVVAVMALQILLGVATLRMVWGGRDSFLLRAKFRLAKGWLAFFSIGLIALSCGFLVVVVMESARQLMICLGLVGAAIVFYFARTTHLARRGERYGLNPEAPVQ